MGEDSFRGLILQSPLANAEFMPFRAQHADENYCDQDPL